MPTLPHIVKCSDATHFLAQVHQLGRRGWVFRGHARAEWQLQPSLHRLFVRHRDKIPESSWYKREKEIIRRFRHVAHLHLRHLPQRADPLSWLALMQQYGGPTRLLDFTFNPTVALYFALREAEPGKGPFCVHAMHLDVIRECSRKARQGASSSRAKLPRNPRAKEYGIGEAKSPAEFVGLYDENMGNERLAAQEGVFLVPSRIDFDYSSWLRSISPRNMPEPYGAHWLEFCFENGDIESYYDLVKQITYMGMSPLRLFPGLDGVCESFRFAGWLEVSKDLTPGT